MANMNIGTPRFYPDLLNYLMSRGVAQNGNFDVTATNADNGFMGTFTTGSEAELFDMNPLNKCTFDTSADTDGHVLITIDTQDTRFKKSYIAILNHNLASSNGKIRVFAGNEASDITALNGGNADTGDIAWANDTMVEVVNGDTTTAAADDKDVVIEPATDGSTIIRFAETSLRYWAIQFEGNTSNTGVAENGTWHGSTDFFVGSIMIGEYFDMPHAPDLELTRLISYNRLNDLQESHGGQRFSNLKSFGRTATSTSKSPFSVGSDGYTVHGGRIIYDMSFSFLNSTEIMPDEYDHVSDDDNFVSDVWNMTNGNHLPFIFSIDKDSEGDNAESEHIFGRFANNSLDMTQVAPEIYNIKLTVEEEF